MACFKSSIPDIYPIKNIRILQRMKKRLGMTPNLIKDIALSPAALKAFYRVTESLAAGALDRRIRELIPLTVAEANGSTYCLSAYTAIGRINGLNENEILAGRRGESDHERVNAGLAFAQAVVRKQGKLTDRDMQAVRQAGFSNQEIVEIIAHVALNNFTNYLTEVVGTPIGFPKVKPMSEEVVQSNSDVE